MYKISGFSLSKSLFLFATYVDALYFPWAYQKAASCNVQEQAYICHL